MFQNPFGKKKKKSSKNPHYNISARRQAYPHIIKIKNSTDPPSKPRKNTNRRRWWRSRAELTLEKWSKKPENSSSPCSSLSCCLASAPALLRDFAATVCSGGAEFTTCFRSFYLFIYFSFCQPAARTECASSILHFLLWYEIEFSKRMIQRPYIPRLWRFGFISFLGIFLLQVGENFFIFLDVRICWRKKLQLVRFSHITITGEEEEQTIILN